MQQKLIGCFVSDGLVNGDGSYADCYHPSKACLWQLVYGFSKRANLLFTTDNLHYERFQDGTVKCIEDEIPFDVPEGWEWCRLSTVLELFSGQDLEPTRYNDKGNGIPYITGASNLDSGKVIVTRWTDSPTTHARAGDLLLTCKGSGVGKMAFSTLKDAHIARQIMALRCNNGLTQDYLDIVVSAFLNEITYQANGIIPGIRREVILNTVIPLPPYKEQLRIAEIVSYARANATQIESSMDMLSKAIEQIRAHILDLAIRGQLVPQDPNDEPASVLLEHIRAEKEDLIKQGKIKRDKNESIIFRGDDNSYYQATGSDMVSIDDDLPFNIPVNWRWCFVRDAFLINPRNHISDDVSSSFVPMTLISEGFQNCCTSEEKKWGDIKTGFTHFADGDIGLAKITPCFENRKSVVFRSLKNGYGAGTTELHILRPIANCVVPEYALCFIKTKRFIDDGVQTFSGAVGQQRVGRDYLENTRFPLPPLAEQQRIVETVSAMFALLDSIIARL